MCVNDSMVRVYKNRRVKEIKELNRKNPFCQTPLPISG
jgi:hypothetical protein